MSKKYRTNQVGASKQEYPLNKKKKSLKDKHENQMKKNDYENTRI